VIIGRTLPCPGAGGKRWLGIVAVTGWGQEQDRQLAAQAGFDTHMTKPADPEQLVELLGARARKA
jgi:CheY-like chemotaxis protein